MKNAVKSEAEILVNIENDLATARREGRFEDALHHLGEILGVHVNTESETVKARCAALLSAPETLQKSA